MLSLIYLGMFFTVLFAMNGWNLDTVVELFIVSTFLMVTFCVSTAYALFTIFKK